MSKLKSKITLLLLSSCLMYAMTQVNAQPKFAVFYHNMVGTDADKQDFSKQKGADEWAPGHTYYLHKDISRIDYISRYVACTDYSPVETQLELKQAQVKEVALSFSPADAVRKYIGRIIRTTNNRVATAERVEGDRIRITAVGPGTCQLILHHDEAGDRTVNVKVLADEAYVERCADSVCNLMTLDEKLLLIGGTSWYYTNAVERLDIPRMRMCDGPVGVGGGSWGPGKSTAYPAGVLLSATWNRNLARQMGSQIGSDCRARGINIILGPAVNIYRSPLCGRNFEYMGEDPYLAAQTSTNYILGVQSQGVSATIKHFMGNNSSYDRDHISNDMDERTMNEIYLPAFKSAVQVAGTGCIMSSYNLLNGIYTTHNYDLLTTHLRDRWGYKGILMSDWGTTHDGLQAALAGLDLEMASADNMSSDNMKQYLAEGKITEETINQKVRHILHTMYKFGFNTPSSVDSSIPLDNPESDLTALQVAREGMVLLKNKNNILPVSPDKYPHIVVTGKNASGFVRGGGSSGVDPISYVSMFDGIQSIGCQLGVQVDYKDQLDFMPAIMFTSEDLSQGGFRAEYFNNIDLSGSPVTTRIESKINNNWSGIAPDVSDLSTENYSVRWSATMCSSTTTSYQFQLGGDDAYRLYIDNELVIDQWNPSAYHYNTLTRRITAGRKYKVVVEYYQKGGDARVDFTWKKLGDTKDYLAEYLADADLVVACFGMNSILEGEGHDRPFNLDEEDLAMLASVKKSGKPVVGFVNAGGSIGMTSWEPQMDALLWAFYAGQNAGTAAGEILFGMTNPSGHLPMTFERRWEENPVYNNYHDPDGDKHVQYKEGIFVGYRGYDKLKREVQYPFGYGLSYTTFEISDVNVSPMDANGLTDVTFTIANTGVRDGAAVVQLYVGKTSQSPVERPVKELKNFDKLMLKAGESRKMRLQLSKNDFTYYDTNVHDFIPDPGTYDIMLGFSSRDIKQKVSITIQ